MAISKDCRRCKGTGQMNKGYKDIWGTWHKTQRCDVCGGNGRNPDYREKRCEYRGGCYTTIVYSAKSSHPPTLCPHHKEVVAREKQEANAKRERENRERQQQRSQQPQRSSQSSHGGDMFRRDLIPSGWESSLVGNVQTHKDHSTMTFRGKGTNGATYRVSWDRYGKAHWTDEGVPEGHANRHRDPRR